MRSGIFFLPWDGGSISSLPAVFGMVRLQCWLAMIFCLLCLCNVVSFGPAPRVYGCDSAPTWKKWFLTPEVDRLSLRLKKVVYHHVSAPLHGNPNQSVPKGENHAVRDS